MDELQQIHERRRDPLRGFHALSIRGYHCYVKAASEIKLTVPTDKVPEVTLSLTMPPGQSEVLFTVRRLPYALPATDDNWGAP